MDTEHVVELNLACHPEAAVSGALLLQDEHDVFLFFNAMSDEMNSEERYESIGTAVIEFKRCYQTRFGCPTEDGIEEHPLFAKGINEFRHCHGVGEVVNSCWAKDVMEQAKSGAKKIWGDGFDRALGNHVWATRHFIASFHDSTFECLADDFVLTIHNEPFQQVFNSIAQKIMDG